MKIRDFCFPIFDDRHWGKFPGESGKHAKALFSFQGQAENELSFRKDDLFIILKEPSNSGWIKVKNIGSNEIGYVPESYLETIA